MKIFYCQDRFEDMMTCIYEAWSAGIKEGHGNIQVKKEPICQQDLFCEYIYVSYDEEKTRKVIRSIQQKISLDAYISVFYASLSYEADAFQAIYDFLRLGFKVGAKVSQMQTENCVMRMMELRRQVGKEAHYFVEFSRFTSVDSKVYLCHIEPKSNVLQLVADHFADRMPSEYWVMVDDKRKISMIHPKDSDFFIRYLTEEEFTTLRRIYSQEDHYTDLWKGFFHAISIKERENPRCQVNHFPVWMRKNAPEFRK